MLAIWSSISCSHYQHFSNALKHICSYRTKQDSITNYLDDFLFLAYLRSLCNDMIDDFLALCSDLGVPISLEKTERVTTIIVFLGILLNRKCLYLSLPVEKQSKALRLLNDFSEKKRITIRELQALAGYLNFLC